MRWLKKALGKTGRKAAEELCTKGYIAAREGRLDAAQKLYDDAIDADETLSTAPFNAGQTALERYNRDAASLSDDDKRERLEQAVGYLRRALELDTQHVPSWRALARVYERLNRIDAAYAAWGRVEGLLLAHTERELSRDDQEERETARKELTRLKSAAELAIALARVKELASSDDHDLVVAEAAVAIDALLLATDVAVKDGTAAPKGMHTIAGILARKASDTARARALLEQAVAEDARDLEAHKNLATLFLAGDDLAAALRASNAAYRLDPTDPALVCNLGVCHLGLGDVDKAAEYIDLAVQMAPKDPIVQRAHKALKEATPTMS